MNKIDLRAIDAADRFVLPYIATPKKFRTALGHDIRLAAHTIAAFTRLRRTFPAAPHAIVLMSARFQAWSMVQPEAVQLLKLDIELRLTPDM